jgi:hypothetical protein
VIFVSYFIRLSPSKGERPAVLHSAMALADQRAHRPPVRQDLRAARCQGAVFSVRQPGQAAGAEPPHLADGADAAGRRSSTYL